jgi:hypothetical protein
LGCIQRYIFASWFDPGTTSSAGPLATIFSPDIRYNIGASNSTVENDWVAAERHVDIVDVVLAIGFLIHLASYPPAASEANSAKLNGCPW